MGLVGGVAQDWWEESHRTGGRSHMGLVGGVVR